MSLNLQAINERNIKANENRYGISIVAFFEEDELLSEFFYQIQEAVDLVAPNTIKWMNRYRLHSTIVRGRSVRSALNTSASSNDKMLQLISSLPCFEVGLEKITLDKDGVIRVWISEHNLLGECAEKLRKMLSSTYLLKVDTQPNHWLSIGSLKPIHVESNLKELYKKISIVLNSFSNTQSHIIEKLALVYYQDIEFRKITILDAVELSVGVKN